MGDSRRASPFALRALAVLVLAGSGAPSMADSLPNASTSVFCSVEGNTFRDALNCEFGGGTVIPSSVVAEAVPLKVTVASGRPAPLLVTVPDRSMVEGSGTGVPSTFIESTDSFPNEEVNPFSLYL